MTMWEPRPRGDAALDKAQSLIEARSRRGGAPTRFFGQASNYDYVGAAPSRRWGA
jgi:hypothetical protein